MLFMSALLFAVVLSALKSHFASKHPTTVLFRSLKYIFIHAMLCRIAVCQYVLSLFHVIRFSRGSCD
jgi:hypothetical protein